MEDKVGITTGEVYLPAPLTCLDGWTCSPIPQEEEEAFFTRSKQEALLFIEKYPELNGQLLFKLSFCHEEL